MPLNAEALTSLVVAEHLSKFPASAFQGVRSNDETGVPLHNVPITFIGALCRAFVGSVLPIPLKDFGGGTADFPGVAVPVPFSFPETALAEAQFIVSQGWTGPGAAVAASVFVGAVLRHTSTLGLLLMRPNPALGSGTGVVSRFSNPELEATLLASLTPALFAQFQATGKFGEGDVPGAPVNAILSAQLPKYAAALAKGYASLTTQVAYVGTASNPAPVFAISNFGNVL